MSELPLYMTEETHHTHTIIWTDHTYDNITEGVSCPESGHIIMHIILKTRLVTLLAYVLLYHVLLSAGSVLKNKAGVILYVSQQFRFSSPQIFSLILFKKGSVIS